MNILVTGGSSGLGASITRRLARDITGKVFFTYNKSEAEAKAIEAGFSNTIAIKCDFKDDASVNELINQMPQLDIAVLINNAYSGSFIGTYFHKTPAADYLSGFNENIMPTIALTQAAINLFRKKKSGKIITILSAVLNDTPPIGAAVYVANKAYLQALTKIWAVENAKYNISSCAVSPSFMLTGFTAAIDERLVEKMANNRPLLTTEEVAESVFQLISTTEPINGVNLLINATDHIK